MLLHLYLCNLNKICIHTHLHKFLCLVCVCVRACVRVRVSFSWSVTIQESIQYKQMLINPTTCFVQSHEKERINEANIGQLQSAVDRMLKESRERLKTYSNEKRLLVEEKVCVWVWCGCACSNYGTVPCRCIIVKGLIRWNKSCPQLKLLRRN